MARKFTSQRKKNRWPMVIWGVMVDISGLNSWCIWKFLHPNDRGSRKQFLFRIGTDLCKAHVASRSITFLDSITVANMANMLGKTTEEFVRERKAIGQASFHLHFTL
jgi:hypothetical protein